MAEDMAKGDDSIWIIKPAAAYCGKGIFLHRSSFALPDHVRLHRGVACRYLSDPLLLDGLKSDVRLYVLITGWHPLTLYLFEDGLARFATEAYARDAIDRRCMHLTNYSLNKHSRHFVKNTDAEQDGVGTKWSLAAFKRRIEQAFGVERAKQARIGGRPPVPSSPSRHHTRETGEGSWPPFSSNFPPACLFTQSRTHTSRRVQVWKEVDDLVIKTAIASSTTMNEGLRACESFSSCHAQPPPSAHLLTGSLPCSSSARDRLTPHPLLQSRPAHPLPTLLS